MNANALYRQIAACRICAGSDLAPVIDLGRQALTGYFPSPQEPDAPVAPLELVRCSDCGLVQLRHSVDVTRMFGDSYGYMSGLNATMRAHLAGIGTSLAAAASLKAGDIVLDIGCNDGTLLTSYPQEGLLRFGIDPIANMFRAKYPKDLTVEASFFDAQGFLALSAGRRARAVSSISMFYDLEDPGAFVADVARVLAPDGVWVFEQSYLPLMLEQNSFDTICHEHLEYYALAQIERLLEASSLRVFDVSLNRINGGSIQIWACHGAGPFTTNSAAIETLRRREAGMALATDAPFAGFRDRVAAIRGKLVDFVRREAAAGKRIYVYGASTKGNVLLQHCRLDHRLIAGCAERNPLKWGRRTPGTAIPIVSEEEARREADHFLVLPWHFRDEFVAREADFLAKGGTLVFPLPEFEVVAAPRAPT